MYFFHGTTLCLILPRFSLSPSFPSIFIVIRGLERRTVEEKQRRKVEERRVNKGVCEEPGVRVTAYVPALLLRPKNTPVIMLMRVDLPLKK